ncbi:MAG: bifunctional 5,10-methylenetetrahydrofolate dehydrogenase/5,10-methenyltetrahydrofolate cyclohydrolase [Candidatus Marinimicrobia bacterium]|nr:bifunctional 5,10-methylenetetrahydrofolate dehydrogenase/5,10-methenyltetrahydrofolate cyclohydrolase [Candidatus Neomarinimicrobiota bacterium]
MSNPLILSGKDVSLYVYDNLKKRISFLKENDIIPGLAVILVGEDPASQIYVRTKAKKFKQLNLLTESFPLNSETSERDLLTLIHELNQNNKFHGILVQLPLPNHINSQKIIEAIDPIKDVDGFHPENAGLLSIGNPRFIPCTPKGIIRILTHYSIDLKGKHVVVVGRSNIVGRPISILTSLKQKGANGTTTICHSGTPNISDFTKLADVVIVALGVPNFLTGEMIKDGTVVIDVGINRIDEDTEKGYKLVGDADWESIQDKVSAVTPVPGGVGPMTIAMLVENTIEAAEISVSQRI